MTSVDTARYWDTEQVADFLGLGRATLEAWRYRGEGPPYVRISSRCVRYDPADVKAWLDALREGGDGTGRDT